MALERLGPYVVERRIGRGGMGTVFAARADVTGEPVAVKVLSSLGGLDDDTHDRFAAEIESLRMLNHPNIVRILGYGEEDGSRYYAMELVAGRSLQEALDARQPFTWQQVVQVGLQLCKALKHAHDRGIVHRDIKPGNVMLTPDGVVKLSDFGIAKSFGNAGMTADGGVLGTAEYMSPEQADGRPATHRSDLYSLGGLLYALAAGRPPFRAKSLVEMLQLQRFAEPESLSRSASHVPRALAELIMQLLAKDPAKRMPSAMMTARALETASATATTSPTMPGEAGPASAMPPADAVSPADADRPAAELPAAPPGPFDFSAPPHATTALSPQLAQAALPASDASADSYLATAEHAAANDRPADASPKQVLTPVPESPRAAPFITRTYTPIDRDDHRRYEPVEETTQPWISPQTWGLVAAMLTLGFGVWWWLQPPSPERLYQRIAEAARQEKIERLVDVENDIHRFLEYYSMDRRARELQGYLDEIDLYRLERKFELRRRILSKNDGLSPIERAYIESIGYVNLDPALGRRKLQALVDLYRDSHDSSKQSRECLRLAVKQLDRLNRSAEENDVADARVVERQLKRADEMETGDPEGAARLRRAIVELYADEPWAEPLVRTARQALEEGRTAVTVQQP